MLERWEQQEGPPRKLEVYWFRTTRSEYSTIVNTTAGKQKWQLLISDSEPRCTLIVEGQEVDRLRRDEWPVTWFAGNSETPP